jgi:hypothetical protein
VIGQTATLKMLHFSDRDTAEKIIEWGFPIDKPTVSRWWIRYQQDKIKNHRENSDRKKLLDEETDG